METTTLGRGGPVVSRAGLGLMGMSGIYGQADDQESLATIRAAVDAGITLLDTGDFYGMGHNEMQIAAAFGREDGASLYVEAPRHRLRRHLPSSTARSERADRGHGRSHRRNGKGRLCPL